MKPSPLTLLSIVLAQAAVLFAQPPSPPGPNQAALTTGNNAFAVALYGQLRAQPGNLFFSPASISTAFGMAYAGARGDTASQMATTLHFTLPPAQLHPAMGALLASLNATHADYQLRVANALWAEQNQKFLPAYLALTKKNYGAGFRPVDFVNQSDKVRTTINDWVAKQTENKIQNLLAPGTVTADTRLVITNAIYFKGTWQTQFQKSQTQNEDFYLTASQTATASLMHISGGYSYFNGGSFQALSIPYKSGDLAMIVLLPNDIAGLAALEQQLTADNLAAWISKLQFAHKVNLTLPKFTLTQEFVLNDTLAAIGMRAAFSPQSADFSGMTGNHAFSISDVIHKAFVDVDEEGTEAAAATSIGIRATAMIPETTPPIEFRCDHPFLFLIRDTRSGAILFMGRVTNPTK
jgi:serine protease inhibitor